MIRELFLRDLSLWTCLWQSSVFAGLGLIAGWLLRQRPARAYQVLLLAMTTAVAVPLLSAAVKHFELGAFVARQTELSYAVPEMPFAMPAATPAADVMDTAPAELIPADVVEPAPFRMPWQMVLRCGWMAATLVLLGRLVVTFLYGVHLVRHASCVPREHVQRAVNGAGSKLALPRGLQVRASGRIRSPLVWCWSRPPILLVPDACDDSQVHWAGVVAHELAHCKRRDHVTGLVAEIVASLLPWNPLIWLSKKFLIRLGEQACDDWVIATGQSCEDYAESLLRFRPQRQPAFWPAVVSSKTGLAHRIRRIVSDACGNPRVGLKWTLMLSIVATGFGLGVAFAQTRPASSETAAKQDDETAKSLHQAAKAGDLEQVKKSIADGADVNATEGDAKSTPLHTAASEGHAQVVKALLEAGAQADTGDSHGCTPLYYAIWSDDNATVRALIAGGANVNVLPGREDYPPLIYAIWQNHVDNVRTLLEAGATLDHRDESGCTPLYWAAFTSGGAFAINRSILDMILAKGDYEDTIYLAACKGQLDKVKTLIETGMDVNRRDEFGCTPLQWAVLADLPDVADFLIANGADIAAKDTMECTALTVARGPAMVELLLSKGADVNAQTTRSGWTRLHNACFAGDQDVAELLLRKGADVNAKSSSNMTPLRFAAQRGHGELVELLIANGADVNAADNRGRTALSIARQMKHTGAVEILLKHGAKETLHAAVAAGDIDEVKQMVSQGVDVNAKDGDGRTPLHLAATQGRKAIAELLIENGANIKAQTKDGETPLHLAANRNYKEVVGTLIDRGADIEARENRYGSTPLLNAAARGHKEVVELLLDRGADIEGKNSDGGTPLSLTAAYGTAIRTDIIQLLLDRGADIETRSNGDSTPLQAAVAVGRREVAELLLAHGAKLDVVSKHWGTTANHAMRSNHPDLVHWCIAKGVEVPPIHQAAYFGEADRVRALLSSGADVNQKDKGGFAPLHCAVFGQRSEVAQLLIKNGADVKAASCGDATPLFWACQQGYLDMVKLLVDNEADVNGRALSKMTWGPALIDNWSNLHMAAHAGHSDVVEYLLDHGADIHARCARGDEDLTPLHMAARNGRVDAVRVLLAKGADASLKSKGGGTALDFARKENHTDVVELLLKHTAKE